MGNCGSNSNNYCNSNSNLSSSSSSSCSNSSNCCNNNTNNNSREGMKLSPTMSTKYGVSVEADGKRIQVDSYQHIFRNKATGLCGDLNGEQTADVKSSRRCMMSTPKLSALSFMIEDGKCKGVPQQEKSELQREEERCVKKEEIPTKVSSIFRSQIDSNRQPELRHLTEEIKGETCFSKDLVVSAPEPTPRRSGPSVLNSPACPDPRLRV